MQVLTGWQSPRIGARLAGQLGVAFARLHAIPLERAPAGLGPRDTRSAVERALEIFALRLDARHPKIVACANNYAGFLRAAGRDGEAGAIEGQYL